MPTQKQFLDNVGLTKLLDELGQYLKTTIPTVNNATLTIQKNGTNVATFTANASSNATANITVPTVTSDLTNDSGFLGDADVSYDANTKTLIIGSSVNTYTVSYSATTSYSPTLTDSNGNTISLPIDVNEGSSFYCETIGALVQVYMGGVALDDVVEYQSLTRAPSQDRKIIINIPSVTGNVELNFMYT